MFAFGAKIATFITGSVDRFSKSLFKRTTETDTDHVPNEGAAVSTNGGGGSEKGAVPERGPTTTDPAVVSSDSPLIASVVSDGFGTPEAYASPDTGSNIGTNANTVSDELSHVPSHPLSPPPVSTPGLNEVFNTSTESLELISANKDLSDSLFRAVLNLRQIVQRDAEGRIVLNVNTELGSGVPNGEETSDVIPGGVLLLQFPIMREISGSALAALEKATCVGWYRRALVCIPFQCAAASSCMAIVFWWSLGKLPLQAPMITKLRIPEGPQLTVHSQPFGHMYGICSANTPKGFIACRDIISKYTVRPEVFEYKGASIVGTYDLRYFTSFEHLYSRAVLIFDPCSGCYNLSVSIPPSGSVGKRNLKRSSVSDDDSIFGEEKHMDKIARWS